MNDEPKRSVAGSILRSMPKEMYDLKGMARRNRKRGAILRRCGVDVLDRAIRVVDGFLAEWGIVGSPDRERLYGRLGLLRTELTAELSDPTSYSKYQALVESDEATGSMTQLSPEAP